jgi:hypothetical protein
MMVHFATMAGDLSPSCISATRPRALETGLFAPKPRDYLGNWLDAAGVDVLLAEREDLQQHLVCTRVVMFVYVVRDPLVPCCGDAGLVRLRYRFHRRLP